MNPRQAEAVAHIDGPLLVIAGAGSGKTRVITHRIANLIQHGTRPDRVLAITFTNKAAGEMQERVQKLMGLQTPWICTFHSMGYRLLKLEHKSAGLGEHPIILDDGDQKKLFKGILKEQKWDEELDARTVGWQISTWKNRLLLPDQIQIVDDREDQILTVYRRYDQLLRSEDLLDFDDLLLRPAHMFRDNPELRAVYQERFPYVLIDEYQDTNSAQYELVRLLGAHGNVCATGDPDQAIYGWRGADIRNILNFERDFPGCTTVLLEQNYRSTGLILKAAQGVVEHNQERKQKTCFTDNGDGKPLVLITVDDHIEEAKAIGIRCQRLHSEGRPLHEMAVFYRTNAQSRVLEEEFIRREIPYQLIGGTRFYERLEIKDVLSYLRLLVNPRETLSFERIINVPARRIGKKTLNLLRDYCMDEGISFHELLSEDHLLERVAVGRNAKVLRDFAMFWRRWQRMDRSNPRGCIEQLVQMTALDEHYRAKDAGEVGEQRVDNLEELAAAADGHEDVEGFLQHVALFTTADRRTQPDQVVLMTLHASKGLEFPVVFIAGCEQGLLPLVHGNREADYEEERRLMYVGITRAMEECYLSRAICRTTFGETKRNPASMFLAEIPDECIAHRNRTGRILPAHNAKPKEGPRYPQDSRAGALLGGKASASAVEHLKQTGALVTGSALLSAARAGGSLGTVERTYKDGNEPVVFETDPYRPGDRVEHALFGPGTVQECRGRVDARDIVIAFDDAGIKKLQLAFAGRHLLPLSPEDEEPPF
ncbi:MAG: ATP-dependent helicase [Planctomycetota bacterium]